MTDSPTLVEVGPRDGFQSIGPFIPTAKKLHFIEALAAVGLTRIEIGSFVSPRAIPQLADTPKLLKAAMGNETLVPQVLVPSERRAMEALGASVRFLVFVLSVSPSHNQSNVRRSPQESVEEYRRIVTAMPAGTSMRLNIATAFDCPFDGRVDQSDTLDILDDLVPIMPEAEICLCDTTGRATPDQVHQLFSAAQDRFPQVGRWAMHAHDTYGLGLANVYAAWLAGVRVFDAAVAGLGGCPFAPGATGNVATEDVVWMFERMGHRTNVDLPALVAISEEAANIDGARAGGRVRDTMRVARI